MSLFFLSVQICTRRVVQSQSVPFGGEKRIKLKNANERVGNDDDDDDDEHAFSRDRPERAKSGSVR